jgi:ribose transport system substrate-binding protein
MNRGQAIPGQHWSGTHRLRGQAMGLLAGLTMVAMVGCSSAATTAPAASAGAATTPAASTAAQASGATGAGMTLGVVATSDTDPGNHTLNAAIEAEAVANGWQALPVIDANGNIDQANSAIQTLVLRKVNAIVVTVFASSGLAAGLAKAKAAGIPVVTWGGGLADGMSATIDVEPWTTETNRMLTDIGNTGNVLAFTFPPGAPCVTGEGVLDKIVAQQPAVHVTKQVVPAPGWIDAADKYTTAWLESHPAGSGPLAVWGCWDGPSVGAANAIARAKRSDVKVYGQTAEADALKAVQNGSFTATVWYDIAGAGKLITDTAEQAVTAGSSWTPKQVLLTNYMVIDGTNIASFIAAHPGVLQ